MPTISGDFVSCLGVSEAQAGSDVAGLYFKITIVLYSSLFVKFKIFVQFCC